jgi:cysteine-rich repeat protein
VLSPGELCDDGNTFTGDGCSATCQIETFPNCGNYIVDQGEECDDGPRGSAACTPRCKRVPGYGFCGDGQLATLSGEQCDDGNSIAGDGCSPNCYLEVTSNCGDGILQQEEEMCDNGPDNSTRPSACRPNCTLPFCGDGIIDYNEQCEINGDLSGDCSEMCEHRTFGAPPTPVTPGTPPPFGSLPPPPSTRNLPPGSRVPPATRTPTGPGLVIFLASGAAAGVGMVRRRLRGET